MPSAPPDSPATDARTTPRWLRLPGLALVLVLTAYFGACYHYALGRNADDLVQSHPWAFWMGTWQMFTTRNDWHVALEAEALVDGDWQAVDLERLFPARWESGLRFQRSSYRRSRGAMAVLGAATCRRMSLDPDLSEPRVVRFREVRWKKTLGQLDQPRRRGLKEKDLLTWSCGRAVRLPDGRRL